MGAALDLLVNAARTLTIEASAVTDNPILFPDSDEVISGGNFHAQPVAFAADLITIALCEVGSLSERRTSVLVDPSMSRLPAFLTDDGGVNSGLMIPQVTAAALAKIGVAQADAFIACWATKYEYNLLRPVTYIKRHIDPKWEPLLITPPFPEYPSGHSAQSGAVATVLTAIFGDGFAFDDETHVDDGLAARSFPSFAAAATEAASSRLYGGIHYRFGNEAGLVQGACVGAYAAALRTEA